MKEKLKFLAYILLIVNSAAALYGGWNLMVYPDGDALNLSTELLEHSPFLNFFIPGAILFLCCGLLGIFTVIALFSRLKSYPQLILLQGIFLTAYIIAQFIIMRSLSQLHLLAGAMGLALLVSGYLLIGMRERPRNRSRK